MPLVLNDFTLSSKALFCQYANTKMEQLQFTEDNLTIEDVIPLNDDLNGVPLSRVIATRDRAQADVPQNIPLPEETNEYVEYDFPRTDILVLIDDWGPGDGTIELTIEDPLDPQELATALEAETDVSFASSDFADIVQIDGETSYTVTMAFYSAYYYGKFVFTPAA